MASSAVCPKPIIISELTESKLISADPEFYLEFTNQQKDLMEIR